MGFSRGGNSETAVRDWMRENGHGMRKGGCTGKRDNFYEGPSLVERK